MINRKAYFEYFILKEYTAGISLQGSEVKSLRAGEANIADSYAYLLDNEIFIKNMFISKFKNASMNNHEELRERKLLLRKKEIQVIDKQIKIKGNTIIPLEIFILNNKFKVKLGVARGKKLYDKKNSIREKDIKLETQRELKQK
jgi:SsrA-binding protein